MEGVWFAYDAATGTADLPARQGDRPHRAPDAAAGQAGRRLPVVARRPQLLAGLVRPEDELRLQRAPPRRRRVEVQAKLTPTQKKRKFDCSATSSSASQNGNFGTVLPGLARPRLDQRDRRRHRPARLEVRRRRSPSAAASRRPPAASASPAAATACCARSTLKTGKVLWTFQTGHQIAAGAVGLLGRRQGVRRDHRRRHADVVERRHRRASCRCSRSAPRRRSRRRRRCRVASAASAARRRRADAAPRGAPARTRAPHAVAGAGGGSSRRRRSTCGRGRRTRRTSQTCRGRLLLNGAPGRAARASASTATSSRSATDANGELPLRRRRHDPAAALVRVAGLGARDRARQRADGGRASALLGASGGFSVGYAIDGPARAKRSGRDVLVTGRRRTTRQARRRRSCRLLTYQLSGTITDASGKPVQGAVVITRTQDRDFWTFSSPTDANGHYSSFFAASDETGADPVPLSRRRRATAARRYGGDARHERHLRRGCTASTMNIQLGARRRRYTISDADARRSARSTGPRRRRRRPAARSSSRSPSSWPDAKGSVLDACCRPRCAARRCASGRTSGSSSRASPRARAARST